MLEVGSPGRKSHCLIKWVIISAISLEQLKMALTFWGLTSWLGDWSAQLNSYISTQVKDFILLTKGFFFFTLMSSQWSCKVSIYTGKVILFNLSKIILHQMLQKTEKSSVHNRQQKFETYSCLFWYFEWSGKNVWYQYYM